MSLKRYLENVNTHRRGFTLIELMIVVAIIGVLSVLAVFGVSRYLKTAKTAEATLNLGVIARNANESLTREMMLGSWGAPKTSSSVNHCVCDSAGATVPTAIASVTAKKYVSNPINDWAPTADAPTKGWKCLKFTIDQPQSYMYNYTSGGSCTTGTMPTTGANGVHAIANGDLDGNGVLSTFDLEGDMPAGQKQLIWAPKPRATQPEE
jgi:prepilin-type N-terminal cleavage/methylation domain-containing protein